MKMMMVMMLMMFTCLPDGVSVILLGLGRVRTLMFTTVTPAPLGWLGVHGSRLTEARGQGGVLGFLVRTTHVTIRTCVTAWRAGQR